MEMLTLVDILLSFCNASIAATVPVPERARREYHGACTFDCDDKTLHLFTVICSIWKSIRGKHFRPNLLRRE